MRTVLLAVGLLLNTAFSQTTPTHRITVFYFGGSDCPHATDPQNIANINRVRGEVAQRYAPTPFKFVMVVMDRSLEQGIQYASKYLPWDELSIGMFYENELMLAHVNQAEVPGVPHVRVYSDSLAIGPFGIPTITRRDLLLDLVGESAINKWIKDSYPLRW